MAYLILSDFLKQIQSDNLNQIIGGDSSILLNTQLTALETASNYLIQKYDLTQELQDTLPWDNTRIYKAGNRVYDPSYKIYNALYTNPVFRYENFYNVGDIVFWKDRLYTCKIATSGLSHDQALQYGTNQGLPLNNITPDDHKNGAQYWGNGTAYSVPAATALTNATFWTLGDNRSQMLVTYMVDITLYHLHSRIAPMNIPDLRVKRYDDAIKHLTMYAKGMITAQFPKLQPPQGNRIRWGSNVKQSNSY